MDSKCLTNAAARANCGGASDWIKLRTANVFDEDGAGLARDRGLERCAGDAPDAVAPPLVAGAGSNAASRPLVQIAASANTACPGAGHSLRRCRSDYKQRRAVLYLARRGTGPRAAVVHDVAGGIIPESRGRSSAARACEIRALFVFSVRSWARAVRHRQRPQRYRSISPLRSVRASLRQAGGVGCGVSIHSA